MAYKRFHIGGLSLSFNANYSGIGVNLSFGGKFWEQLAHFIKGTRSDISGEQQATGSEPVANKAVAAPNDGKAMNPGMVQAMDSIRWYHTLDFGNGIKTKGVFDHAPILDKYKLPDSFSGKRILDVATFDGYWAFEFERRGAKEVVALDLDGPAELDMPPKRRAQATKAELAVKFGRGFEFAKAQLKSNVRRVTCSIYDLTPGKLGTFDVVHSGDVLLHLNSPVRALQNIAQVCTEYALISDVCNPELEHFPGSKLMDYLGGRDECTWWKISPAALEQMILDAGFSRVELLARFKYGLKDKPKNAHHVVFKAYK